MARRSVRRPLVAIALAVVALLLYSNPATAEQKVKITTRLTSPLDPISGTIIGDPDGSGKAEFELVPEAGAETGEICFTIKVKRIAEPAEPAEGLGSAHIHFVDGGGIAVTLVSSGTKIEFEPKGNDEFKATGCVDQVDQTLLSNIIANPAQYYVNIHNADFKDGALSGVL